MAAKLSAFMDWFSEFIAHRKGLLPLIGILLIVGNFLLQVFATGWMVQTNCLLHLGLVIAVFGLLAARAL
jgi:hypothetical protein